MIAVAKYTRVEAAGPIGLQGRQFYLLMLDGQALAVPGEVFELLYGPDTAPAGAIAAAKAKAAAQPEITVIWPEPAQSVKAQLDKRAAKLDSVPEGLGRVQADVYAALLHGPANTAELAVLCYPDLAPAKAKARLYAALESLGKRQLIKRAGDRWELSR